MPRRLALRTVLFRLHWLAGISAGLVLAVVGFSGGLIGVRAPLERLLDPAPAAAGRVPLTPDRWIEHARAAWPDAGVRSVEWNGEGERVRLRLARGAGPGEEVALDPYSGAPMPLRGREVFEAIERVHRTLAAGPVGKQLVGASTALLIAIVLGGIYLRWPRRPLSPRAWLSVDLRLRGRALLWRLHAVAGTWLLAFYLLAAATGLWWSYAPYRDAVNRIAGVPSQQRRPRAAVLEPGREAAALDGAWAAFRAAVPEAIRATFAPVGDATTPLEIRYLTADSPHERAWNSIRIDAGTGAIVGRELQAQQPRGRRFVGALYALHSGTFFGAGGSTLMVVASLLMPFFALTGLWLWLLRRRTAAHRSAVATRAPRGEQAARAIERELRDADPRLS
jgi:uncharacterized iron-regulated membrane protein